MASPVKDAKNKHIANGFTEIVERGRGHLRSRKPGTNQYALTTQVGGRGWHFGQEPFTEANEIDTAWVTSSGAWDYEVTKNDFHSFVRDSVPVSYRYLDAATQHYVELTVSAIEWVNDEGQSEEAASFSQVTPTIDDDTIQWNDIAPGWDVRIEAQTTRLAKWLDIDSLANLGSPTIGGTNIRLQMRFTYQKSSGLEIWIDGEQWDEKNNTWKETSGDIEFRDATTQQAVFGFKRPSGHDVSDDPETSEAPMIHRVRRLGVNFYAEIDTPWNWLQSATFPISLDDTIDDQVGASDEDASERGDDTDFSSTANSIYIQSNTTALTYNGGFYFNLSGISQGDTIGSTSYMEFYCSNNNDAQLRFYAHDVDSTDDFTSTADIANRVLTTEYLEINIDDVAANNQWWNTYTDDSLDISAVIQEIVDRPSWDAAAIMMILWGIPYAASKKTFFPDSYDGSSTFAAKLHIEYTAGGVTVTPAAVSAIASSSGPSAVILGSVSITPAASSALASSIAPTVVLGSLSLSPGSVSAIASSSGPSAVILGSVSVTPAASSALASSIAPTIVLGSTSVTPAACSAIASKQDPTVAISSVSVTPSPVSAIASSSGPSAVILGSVSVTPGSVSAIASSIDPVVLAGGTYNQPHFRIRSDDSVGLNVDSGWAANLDTNATIEAGRAFRVRFEVEEPAGLGSAQTFKLQYRLNAGSWADVATQSSATSVTPIIGVLSNQYANNAATTDILSGSSEAFDTGAGLEDDTVTNSLTIDNEHTEIEICLMMVGFYDGYNQLADNDTIELRLTEGDGTEFASYTIPTITVSVPDYYIGGCYIESPVHAGPLCDGNGNLYFIMELSSVENTCVMLKSTDGGKSWAEIDGSNRPSTTDFEAGEAVLDGDEIHIVQHKGSSVVYHKFRVSTHSTNPDTWEVTDETVISGISETDQAASLAVLSSGDVWCFYRRTVSSYEQIKYKRRNGSWGSENDLDTEASTNFSWVTCVVGASDKTHIFYQDQTNGIGYHRSLTDGGSLSSRESISSTLGTIDNKSKSILKPVYWDDGGDEKIMVVYWDDSDDKLHSRIITNDGSPGSASTVTDAIVANGYGGSRMPAAATAQDNDQIYIIYSDESTLDMWYTESEAGGSWSTDIELEDGTRAYFESASIFTHKSANGGQPVIGWIVENDMQAGGDDGYIWYFEANISLEITPAAASCIASGVDPNVDISGGITVSPSAVSCIGSTSGPTIVLGSVSVTPAACSAIASKQDPTVIGGSVTVTPSPVSCVTSSIAPTIVLGSVSVSPSALSAICTVAGPTVVEGGAILTIDFEEGTLADFDSTTNGEDLAANNASVLVGAYGMEVTCDDTSVHYGFNSLSISTGEIRFRFYLDPNGLTMDNGDDIDLCRIQCDGSYSFIDELCTVIMRYSSGVYQVQLNVEPDNGIDRQTTWTTITDNSHYIEVLMQSESTDGAADGVAKIWIDGVETSGSITDLENYNVFATIDGVRFGIAYGQESGTTGSFYLDDLVIRDDDTQIGPAQSSLTYAPGSVSSIASKSDPFVIQSSISFTPGAVSCIAAGVDPTVAVGSNSVTPFPASCIAAKADPDVIQGSLSLSPGSVTSIASSSGPSAVIHGSISITPTPSHALASSYGPTVYVPPLLITPAAASGIAQAGGVTVNVNGDLYCIPFSAVTYASTVDPTVLEIPYSIINLTLYDRSFSWGDLYERSGFFVVFNVLFEDGVIMEFEDGDEVTWGASRSGFSLPARDLDMTLTEERD
ncbi:MAG: hypothetical protein ACWGQW_03530 [bacterium]